MNKRTTEMNKENGYKGQIAKLRKQIEELKSRNCELKELAEDANGAAVVIESEAGARIRCLKRFMERLVAPMNKETIKVKNPELAIFIDQTLAAIDFAGEII